MRLFGYVMLLVASACNCGSHEDCTQQSFGAPFCVPDGGVAPAGHALQLDLVDQCHASCGATSTLKCFVTRDGGNIVLELAGEICTVPMTFACPDVCQIQHLPCAVPPLEEGDYLVRSEGFRSLSLHVGDGGDVSCSAAPL